jgi:hypothetical protein
MANHDKKHSAIHYQQNLRFVPLFDCNTLLESSFYFLMNYKRKNSWITISVLKVGQSLTDAGLDNELEEKYR